ncbi:MAG: PDDEXK nuclease domain-containing protein [Chitinispirillales bacterium]|jgi:predicted nuclease of restriction endonuclease-like (RecB) superfamily|nr:PDDEXK nuclease domain-containing protein [Chitinispirillales bacterium]
MKSNYNIAKMKNSATNYISEIKQILADARQKAYSAVNSAMVEAYWLIGKRIVEEEQQGKERAAYGEEILKTLSAELTKEFGKGFGTRNLWDFKKFYLTFSEYEIMHTLCAQLTWSHVRLIMRVESKDAQKYYLKEASERMWSVRTLDRNISTLYYQRLLSSQVKEPVIQEMQEKTRDFQQDKLEFIKNPSVLEFLGLPNNGGYTESQLEQAIINDMQKFLLELGKGFAFVERQQLVRTETSEFYIDLVFYNYILKCFVIVELKTHKITHQDIGQLDMYVRMYDDLKRAKDDNPTIGILLCTETDKTIARYSVLSENQQLFAGKYLPYLPTEEELAAEIERQKMIFKQRQLL